MDSNKFYRQSNYHQVVYCKCCHKASMTGDEHQFGCPVIEAEREILRLRGLFKRANQAKRTLLRHALKLEDLYADEYGAP